MPATYTHIETHVQTIINKYIHTVYIVQCTLYSVHCTVYIPHAWYIHLINTTHSTRSLHTHHTHTHTHTHTHHTHISFPSRTTLTHIPHIYTHTHIPHKFTMYTIYIPHTYQDIYTLNK